jgi:LPXTG-motif cell wall-anchored protein
MLGLPQTGGEDMDGIIGLIISLISGAVGGNIAGAALKE